MPSVASDPTSAGNWRAWLSALGPGAVVASLTIGTGELIFSTRAGSLFGYRILGLFLLVLLLKWALVLGSARHWVLSDVQPLRRWAELPGPRGWLPAVLLLLAIPAFPVWVSFHSGTIGTLFAAVTNTQGAFAGDSSLAWGIVILGAVQILVITGGYTRLERIQAIVVALLVFSILAALVRLRPDWGALVSGFFHLGGLHYPAWAAELPEFSTRPVWVETATYVGVIGGSGYDYLAYVAWLREKHGSRSDRRITPGELYRRVMLDATVSFGAVLLFSMAFVVCGNLVLGPRHEVPMGSDLLTLQAQFVRVVGDWLQPVYFVGAFLVLIGTLYGTIEVAPAVARELVAALVGPRTFLEDARLRRWVVHWCGLGALALLAGTLAWRLGRGTREPFNLVALVTPANLFTGVLACGWICLLNVWTDHRFLPAKDRMRSPLMVLNSLGAAVFCGVGAKAVWDHGGWVGPGILGVSIAAGVLLAAALRRRIIILSEPRPIPPTD